MTSNMSQARKILRFILKHGSITTWQAIHDRNIKCTRLSGRILDLKESGVRIKDRWVKKGGKRFKEYALG